MTKGFAIIDMDGTILSKRTVDVLCEEFGRLEELKMIDEEASNLTEREGFGKGLRWDSFESWN
jgi:2-hydroxy-3-keto-5-methylthiopentenyl-1-phosphate phosphatase